MALKHLLRLFSSEILIVAFGLLVGVFVARGFGVEAKGALASIAAIVGLGSALSSFGVPYSAVKLGSSNTNWIMIKFSVYGSIIALLFLVVYNLQGWSQFNVFHYILELYIILFLTIYNLQSLAFILSRSSKYYYPLAIVTGQVLAFLFLLVMFFIQQFEAIWVTLTAAAGQFFVSFYYIKKIHLSESKVRIGSLTQYLKLSLNQAPIIYITAISIHIPILALSSVSLKEVGIYSVAAASVLVLGKIPRLLHGMTIGGIMFNNSGVRSDFFKLQFVMILLIAMFHLMVSFLIQSLYGLNFLPAVSVAVILAYSMIPLIYIGLGEARMIVFEKYNTLIAYKFITVSLLGATIFILLFFDFEFNAELMAWCIFGYRYLSFIFLIITTRFASVRVFA
ncbi:hypothetical protein OAT56_02075 [Amylibacter sp.]|nr:hypothetical protein [Amylibacter sp.]